MHRGTVVGLLSIEELEELDILRSLRSSGRSSIHSEALVGGLTSIEELLEIYVCVEELTKVFYQ